VEMSNSQLQSLYDFATQGIVTSCQSTIQCFRTVLGIDLDFRNFSPATNTTSNLHKVETPWTNKVDARVKVEAELENSPPAMKNAHKKGRGFKSLFALQGPCSAEIINVESESELMAKGDMFLKLHAAYHSQAEPELKTSRIKTTVLVKLLSRHYLNFHRRYLMEDLDDDDSMRQSSSEKRRKCKRDQSPLEDLDPLDLQSAGRESDHGSEGPRMKVSRYEGTEPPRNHAAPKRNKPRPKLPLTATGKKTKAQEIFDQMMQVVDDDVEKDESDKKNQLQVCVTCGKMFPDAKQLESHKMNVGVYHNDHCPRCPDVQFKSWPDHQAHQQKEHRGVFFKRCKHCPEAFEDRKTLLAHSQEAHKVEKVVCTECGATVSKNNLTKHTKLKHSKKEYQCDICLKHFGCEKYLIQHKMCHDVAPCQLCGKLVKENQTRTHNLNYHTPESEKPFVCQICVPTKGFITTQSLEDHMNVHNGLRPHVCTLCPSAAYASRANLNAHVRATHKGLKRKPKA